MSLKIAQERKSRRKVERQGDGGWGGGWRRQGKGTGVGGWVEEETGRRLVVWLVFSGLARERTGRKTAGGYGSLLFKGAKGSVSL